MAGSYETLVESIRRDPIASDFLWSVFVAALHSYRHDTVLRPFPHFYMSRENGEKNVERLKSVVKDVASFRELMDGSSPNRMSEESIQLLSWALQSRRRFTLKSHPASKFDDIQQLTKQQKDAPLPNYIFEVVYQPEMEAQFQAVVGSYDLIYAYHGSSIENFYSILCTGLHHKMNKTSAYGEGTYLSSELSVSLVYSPLGQGWMQSLIGDRLGCVAVCELIGHPNVKMQTKESIPNQPLFRIINNNNVPENYFLVQNDELVRVKYVLVYAEKTSRRFQSVNKWMSNHTFALTMLCYLFILICIGLKNTSLYQKFINYITK